MDTNGIFSNSSGGSGMLGLEMSLSHHHHHNQQQQQQNPQQNPNFFHHQPPFAGAGKQTYPYAPKQRASPISDEEEPVSNNMNNPSTTEDSGGGGGGGGGGDGKMRKGSPWQRMKWTDNMVRLLIMVVFYIGDEVSSDKPAPAGSDTPAAGTKRKAGAGGGVLQKKGKWKSVSRAMMERGFYVSPQQCEDKFNDLNKRYKRVNDILGKGTACKVVENQSLLESMDHLPAKMKEEAKKLLNSKHLFFREMCAYHNSGAGAGAGAGSSAAHHSSPPGIPTTEQTPAYINHRQNCVHSNDNEEEEEEDDGDDEDDDVDGDGDGGRYHLDDEEDEGLSSRKRARIGDNDGYEGINVIQQFRGEISCVIQDLTKSIWEKRQWMKGRMMQLEEQRVGFQGQSYELEKQRLKWIKFSCKKEREMEVEKLRNERMKLENERMVLLLRQKDLELGDLQQQYSSSNAHK